ncbi:MAG: universal stress protein [Chloroflexota bacterium]|nr:universal stress protein [Chloroflexota bacterium]
MHEAILVPLDGSPLAETVLPPAAALAAATGRDLLLLGVTPGPARLSGLAWPQLGLLAQIPDRPAEATAYRDYLTGVAARLTADGLAVRAHLRQGDPAEQILAQLRDEPELTGVALATHGRSGLQRTVLGSVAERIIQAAPVPVLLVRGTSASVTPSPYRRILVPLDGSRFAAQALDVAVDLAASSGATLLLLAVLPPLQDLSFAEAGLQPFWMEEARIAAADAVTLALDETAVQLASTGLPVRTLLRHGSPAAAIVECGTTEAADLIVLATHGRSGLPRLWLGSVALGVVRTAAQPVLTVRPSGAMLPAVRAADHTAVPR